MESLSLQSLVPDDELMVRKSVSYRPRVGADYFIQHGRSVTPTSSWGFLRFQYHEKSPFSRLLQEKCDTTIKERVAELMEQIRSMSKDPTDILQTMNLVDSIQLLGLDYRFEKEISEALNHIHDAHIDDHVLCDTALRFRLQRERSIEDMVKWWNEIAPSKSLDFARDRLVECYYWTLGIYFEPHYSRARMITAKVFALISIMDDIYDVYSTLEESQQFTEAIQRWDAKAVHKLPEYMKDYFLKLIHTFEEFETLLALNEKYRLYYLKESMKAVSKAYFEESKWSAPRYVPTLEEHLQVSLISAANPVLECASFVGMGEIATEEVFKWITSFPKIVQASGIISRIMNDITSHELEQTREHVASTVQCYMKEFGIDVHVTCKKLQGLVDDAWKKINEECLNPTAFSFALLERIINYSRMAENINKHIDGYTNSSMRTKEYISLLLVYPIPL
nr:PREDICTED: alpha-humulene synthase-like [Musa acuminata subsp. malaccensis]